MFLVDFFFSQIKHRQGCYQCRSVGLLHLSCAGTCRHLDVWGCTAAEHEESGSSVCKNDSFCLPPVLTDERRGASFVSESRQSRVGPGCKFVDIKALLNFQKTDKGSYILRYSDSNVHKDTVFSLSSHLISFILSYLIKREIAHSQTSTGSLLPCKQSFLI